MNARCCPAPVRGAASPAGDGPAVTERRDVLFDEAHLTGAGGDT